MQNRGKAIGIGVGLLLLVGLIIGGCGGCGEGGGGGGGKTYRMNDKDVQQFENMAVERDRSDRRTADYDRMSGKRVD